jgi:hypothetical protein
MLQHGEEPLFIISDRIELVHECARSKASKPKLRRMGGRGPPTHTCT